MQQDRKEEIELSGELTLPRAQEIKDKLVQALEHADAVGIRFRDVPDVDLSCLQLLCSAHRTAVRAHKRLVVAGAVPKVLKDTAAAAGYLRIKGCTLDTENSCIWMSMSGASCG